MTKQTSSAIHTLIEIAGKESGQAAEALAEAGRLLKESERNLDMLLEYRNDYIGRLEQNSQQGLFAESYQNFQSFLSKLNQAIVGQQTVVDTCKQKVADQRKYWQECERRKLSYGVLITKAETREQRAQLQKDQKLMDEHALRQSMKKTYSR